MQVIKRNKDIVDFTAERIEIVLKKAGVKENQAKEIAGKVQEYFEISGIKQIKIDDIQDVVVKYLEHEGLHAIRDHYLNYMTERNEVRKKGASLVAALGDIINSSHASMKENANVNADGPMGKMLKVGSQATKDVFVYNMPKKFAKAHAAGDIHIHDLEFHNWTLTCAQIGLDKLFTGGFGTGHGKIREPGRIQSYASLACIAIQSNQNDQHGGQSIPLFDYYLAPGVIKSYQKNLRDILFNDLSVIQEIRGNFEFRKLKAKDLLDYKELKMEVTAPSSTDPIFNKIKAPLKNIKYRNFASILVEAHRKALEKTDEETFQAMESVVHNLNTMHCLPASEEIWVYDNTDRQTKLITMENLASTFETGKYQAISLNKGTLKSEYKDITAVFKKDNHRRLVKLTTILEQQVTVTDNHYILSLKEGQVIDILPEEAEQVAVPAIKAEPGSGTTSLFINQENFGERRGLSYVEPDEHAVNIKVAGKEILNSNEEYVYDISVADNENFLTRDGIFVHNSRAGAQVPFSSINYGTDTSLPGRMVTRNILLALEAGMGNGEIPIFPIHIFKVKSGVNYEEGTPNHDLFKIACRVTSKRMFPNYAFLDAPYNLKYLKAGKPETEVVYMGCVDGSEVITYRINGDLIVESFKAAYNRVKQLFDEIHVTYAGYNGPPSTYLDTAKGLVEIFDSSRQQFVKVKKFTKKGNENNWWEITLANGRSLLATEDHPLPVEGRGRVLITDLEAGDKIPIVTGQYAENDPVRSMHPNIALMLGVAGRGDFLNQHTSFLPTRKQNLLERYKEFVENYGCHLNIMTVEGGFLFEHKRIENLKQKIEAQTSMNNIFSYNLATRKAFLAGVLNNSDLSQCELTNKVELTFPDKDQALCCMALIQSVGSPVEYTVERQETVRYRLKFSPTGGVGSYMVPGQERDLVNKCNVEKPDPMPALSEVKKMQKSLHNGESYDVETESDMFDVSGIQSHNCRTRVIGNVHDPEREIVTGRGNLSFTSINLPRIAIIAKGDMDKFREGLKQKLDLVQDQLLYRMGVVGKLKVRNFPFLMGQGVWIDSEKLGIEDEISEVIKHGTLSVGFIGLAETLKVLTGKHHGESEESQKLGIKIIKTMREYCDEASAKLKLNFTLIATPAEGLSGRFLEIDREKYGRIPGVTDHEFYTNSFHVPVYYDTDMLNKITIEAPYHELCNAGHISYVETSILKNNPEAVESIVKLMYDHKIGYGGINQPIDICCSCSYSGIIDKACPKCGKTEAETDFRRIRRVTGYLSGSLENFNKHKKAEVAERSKHDGKRID